MWLRPTERLIWLNFQIILILVMRSIHKALQLVIMLILSAVIYQKHLQWALGLHDIHRHYDVHMNNTVCSLEHVYSLFEETPRWVRICFTPILMIYMHLAIKIGIF